MTPMTSPWTRTLRPRTAGACRARWIDEVQRERHGDRRHDPRRPEVAEAAAGPDDDHDDGDERGEREVHRERDVRVEAARARHRRRRTSPSRHHRRPAGSPRAGSRRSPSRAARPRSARRAAGEQRERERLASPSAFQIPTSAPSGSDQYHAGRVATPAVSATSPRPMQPSTKPSTECTTSQTRSRHVCGSPSVEPSSAAQPAARLAVARPHRPARNHAVLRRSSSAVQRKTIAEPMMNGSPTMKIDERERHRQAGDPDAAGERAREQAEREVAGVTGGLRGDRADAAR